MYLLDDRNVYVSIEFMAVTILQEVIGKFTAVHRRPYVVPVIV